jgi:predicted MPP superfamily phosphohydrolase
VIYLYIIGAIAVLFLLYMRFEAGFVEAKRIKLTSSKKCLKLIQLSDIHINRLKVSQEKVRKIIQAEKPDLLILTGDYVEKPGQIPLFLSFARKLPPGPKVLFTLGNHDLKFFEKDELSRKKFIGLLEELGWTYLCNSAICFEKNSRKYNIIGIDDLTEGHPEIEKTLASCRKDAYANIAFSHNPDIVLRIPRGGVDYLLCGHFHGGQIWTPFKLEFKLLRTEKLCRMGITRGLHKMNNINLYINRGLGNVCVPLRFLSRPEVTVFYLP